MNNTNFRFICSGKSFCFYGTVHSHMAFVQQIPATVAEKLSAGYRIGSFCQCVEELVFNSIDANAAAIAVRIDVDKRKIQVVDKGEGIEPNNMQTLGEKCSTNKAANCSKFGCKGEILAAIVELSKSCTIESASQSSNVTVRKQFINGQLCSLKKCKSDRTCPGTTVTIKNLFYALPVRQKQHRTEIQLEQIVQTITALSVCHSNISFSLRDECGAKILVQTRRTISSANTFQALFHASYPFDLIECTNNDCTIVDQLTTALYLGPKPFQNSSLQFVFVNGRPVFKTRLHRIIHEQISNSIKKITDWVFILKLSCPKNQVEIFSSDGVDSFVHFKNWNEVEYMLSNLIKTFFLGQINNFSVEEKSTVIAHKQRHSEFPMVTKTVSDVIRSKVVKNIKVSTDSLTASSLLPAEIAESLEDGNVAETNAANAESLQQDESISETKEITFGESVSSKNFVNESMRLSRIQPTWNLTDTHEQNVGNTVGNLGIWSTLGDVCSEQVQSISKIPDSKGVDHLQLSRNLLPSVRVINQLDKKFIVCSLNIEQENLSSSTNILLIFDQHAVSERIYLENLLSEHGLATTVSKSNLKELIALSMNSSEIRFIVGFLDKFEKFGITFLVQREESALTVSTVPCCLLLKEKSDLKNLNRSRLHSDLQAMISQITDALRKTKGVLSNRWIPKCLNDILNTIACRSAIKFGDVLTVENCENLLQNLSKCQNPFECAHGRPSMVPIANISCFYA